MQLVVQTLLEIEPWIADRRMRGIYRCDTCGLQQEVVRAIPRERYSLGVFQDGFLDPTIPHNCPRGTYPK